ncbi:MAG: nucleotide exchange factor GrpE [Nitrospirae bacterium]|nr:nucleotide exchange factor GrpE [Nitrospirota bacterium]
MEEKEVRELEAKKDQPLEERQEEEIVPVEPPLEERLKALEEELQETKDKYLRLYAEFDNYRKRVQKDREELLKYGSEPLIMELLTIVDNLEMALSHAQNEPGVDSLVKGIELTLKEFHKILKKYGVEEIEALGKPFDPQIHHAMSQVVRTDVDEMTVVEEYRKGYKLNDKVIRPSLVAVSKRSDEEPEAEKDRDVSSPEENNKETKEEN